MTTPNDAATNPPATLHKLPRTPPRPTAYRYAQRGGLIRVISRARSVFPPSQQNKKLSYHHIAVAVTTRVCRSTLSSLLIGIGRDISLARPFLSRALAPTASSPQDLPRYSLIHSSAILSGNQSLCSSLGSHVEAEPLNRTSACCRLVCRKHAVVSSESSRSLRQLLPPF